MLRQLGLEWEQYINTTRNNVEYGLMIIHKDKYIRSPWSAMMTAGLEVVNGRYPCEELYNIYNIYMNSLSGNYRPFL